MTTPEDITLVRNAIHNPSEPRHRVRQRYSVVCDAILYKPYSFEMLTHKRSSSKNFYGSKSRSRG